MPLLIQNLKYQVPKRVLSRLVCKFFLKLLFTTRNSNERSPRSSKTNQKVSGQFKNIDRDMDYANIKTYI